jgi:hypothetical protein
LKEIRISGRGSYFKIQVKSTAMKKVNFHPSFLQIIYFLILLILFSLIIYTPTLIRGSASINENLILEEETIEGSLVGVLMILGILILGIYKHEIQRHKEQIRKIDEEKQRVAGRLLASDQYIGQVNVQITEIESIFNSIDKYPQTKADFNKVFSFFGERILGIVYSKWALIRIINRDTQKTITEHFHIRPGSTSDYPHVSNKLIIEKEPLESCISIISKPDNLEFLVSCTLPVDKINKHQLGFIQAIINEITMLFVIYNFSNSGKNGVTSEITPHPPV